VTTLLDDGFLPATEAQPKIVYSLMSFGFPIDALPISDYGELKRDKHRELLKMKQKCENMSIKAILTPSNSDVLFGRGKPFQQRHQGNMLISVLVESLAAQSGESNNKEKTVLAQEVLIKMKNTGVNFLKQVDGIWEVVDDLSARENISNTFRSTRLSMTDKDIRKRPRPN
jgi:hypothetical protein